MVEIHGPQGLIARGLTAYAANDLEKIKGLSTASIEEKLGYIHSPEAIHRDDLTLVD